MSIAQKLGISEELFQLINDGFDRALENLQSSGEAFNPFILVEGGEKLEFRRLVAPQPEQAVRAGRVLIGRLPGEKIRYALVFDGRVPLDGEPHDAVIVEGGERCSDFGVAVAMYYRSAPGEEVVEQVGNPRPLGRIDNYFANE